MPSSKSYKRDYKREKETSDARGEKADRASRNRARLKAKKAGKKVAGKDVDHKDGNPKNNSPSNLRVQSKSKNRSVNRKKKRAK